MPAQSEREIALEGLLRRLVGAITAAPRSSTYILPNDLQTWLDRELTLIPTSTQTNVRFTKTLRASIGSGRSFGWIEWREGESVFWIANSATGAPSIGFHVNQLEALQAVAGALLEIIERDHIELLTTSPAAPRDADHRHTLLCATDCPGEHYCTCNCHNEDEE